MWRFTVFLLQSKLITWNLFYEKNEMKIWFKVSINFCLQEGTVYG